MCEVSLVGSAAPWVVCCAAVEGMVPYYMSQNRTCHIEPLEAQLDLGLPVQLMKLVDVYFFS